MGECGVGTNNIEAKVLEKMVFPLPGVCIMDKILIMPAPCNHVAGRGNDEF